MRLIKYDNPWNDPFTNFDRWFDLALGGRCRWPGEALPDSLVTGGFRLDLYEDDENYHAVAELPGVAKSDLTVQLDNGVLTIGAERVRKDDTGKKFKLSRTISVTEDVEPGKVSAKYEDGILIVALPKAEARKPRSIQVN